MVVNWSRSLAAPCISAESRSDYISCRELEEEQGDGHWSKHPFKRFSL